MMTTTTTTAEIPAQSAADTGGTEKKTNDGRTRGKCRVEITFFGFVAPSH